MNVDLHRLTMRAVNSMCGFTWLPFCSLFSIWKSRFCSHGAVSLGAIGMLGFWSMVLFLGILTIGFIYEWKKGALEWE